jgi:hypothetical protein
MSISAVPVDIGVVDGSGRRVLVQAQQPAQHREGHQQAPADADGRYLALVNGAVARGAADADHPGSLGDADRRGPGVGSHGGGGQGINVESLRSSHSRACREPQRPLVGKHLPRVLQQQEEMKRVGG